MAERRMFSKKLIEGDAFCDMSLSTQALYFHIGMRADDDGFMDSMKTVMKMVGANQNDFDVLLAKNFILDVGDGVYVVKHWKLHNYIQKDRYRPTTYTDKMAKLGLKENKIYTLDTNCIQHVRVGKDRVGKDREGKDREGKDIDILKNISENDLLIAKDFLDYRRTKLKKPVKTDRGLKLHLKNIKECVIQNLGTVEGLTEMMKDEEWQTIKPDWIKKTSSKKSLYEKNTEYFKKFQEDETIDAEVE